MEATVLCHFIWVWFSMPKVLWHKNSPISLERVVWFCWFLQVVICILLDIHWSYKNMLFWAGIVRHSLSSSQIARYKVQKGYKVSSLFFASIGTWINMLFCVMTPKYSCQFAGYFTFSLFCLLNLISGAHFYSVLVLL